MTIPRTQKIAYGTEPSQYGVLHLPSGDGPFPVVVMIHGGWWAAMWDDTAVQPLIADLVDQGYAVWSIEYRRVGEPGGGWPGTFEDVARAVDLVAELKAPLDLQRVAVVGHSAGGHLATWTAHRATLPDGVVGARPRVRLVGAVSIAGVLDLVSADNARLGTELADLDGEPPSGAPGPSEPDAWPIVAAGVGNGMTRLLLGASAVEDPDLYAVTSPVEMADGGVPVLAIHGAADEVIPAEFSRTYAKSHALAEFVESPGGDHFSVIEPDGHAWTVARKWLGEKLA
ncbi:alpha/beta hydrolase [Lentzea sp. NPDC034063]|uniref:alpha/beta hydrolase family protein n=1 Tax=unclassified Lentzea TaxID=2643253 RepID=UPI0033F2C783